MPELPEHNLNFGAPLLDSSPSFAGAREMSRAASDLGRSIGRGADLIGEATLEVQDFQDKGVISEGRTRMMAAEQEHETFRTQNPQQEAWGQNWAKQIGNVEQWAKGQQLLPKNQIRLQEMVGEWSHLTTLGVRDAMIGQGLRRAQMSWDTSQTKLVEGRRYDEARDNLRDKPGALPEEVESELAKIDQIENIDAIKLRVEMYTNFEPGGGKEARDLLAVDDSLAPFEKERIKQSITQLEDKQTADSLAEIGSQMGQITSEKEFMARLPDWMDVRTKEIARRGYGRTEPLQAGEIQAFEDRVDALSDIWGKSPMPAASYEAERAKILRDSMALGNRPGADRIHRIIGQLTNEAQAAKRATMQAELDKIPDAALQSKIKFASGLYQDLSPTLLDFDTPKNATKEAVMDQMEFWLSTDGKDASYFEIQEELKKRMVSRETTGLLLPPKPTP